MDLAPVPQIQVPHAKGTGTIARAGGRNSQGPPLWKVRSCLFVGPQRQAGRGEAVGSDTQAPVAIRNKQQVYSMVCWKGSKEKSTTKVEDPQVKVLGICLLTVPYLENQKFF